MSISYQGIGEWCATFGCSAYLVLSVDSAAGKAVIKL